MQVGLIVLVMATAMASVLTGLDKGVRRLSELIFFLAVLLMLFVLIVGPTGFLLQALVQNFGLYLDHFFIRTFNLYAYEPRGWMSRWTLFSGPGGSPGRRSWACSSPASHVAEPCGNSSSAFCWRPPHSRFFG